MSRTLFIFIWLVLLASCDKMDISPAQSDSFIKFYNTFPVFIGSDVKEIPGKGYVILGTVASITEGNQICLIRTDLYGNSLDTARYFGGQLDQEACHIEVLNDHGFAILGQTIDISTNKKAAYFLRTDSVGNILIEKTITGLYDVVPRSLKLDASGEFYLVGYGMNSKGGAPLNKDIWLYAMDPLGNFLWQRYIGDEYDNEGNDLQLLPAPDGRIVITGTTTTSDKKKHAFVLRAAPNGLGGSLFPITSTVDEEATCIQTIDENTFIISGTSHTSTSESHSMMKKVAYSLTGLSAIWDIKYGEGSDQGVCALLDENNLYLLATTSSTGINTTITLITTDLEGGNPVYSEIGEGSQLSASSFEKTADHGFIIAGTNKHSENDQSMALIKLKSNASLW
jgi:hypothetical protein